MSKETAGKLVQFTTKEGVIQKAIARNVDQSPSFVSVKRAFVRLVNDDLTDKKDEAGKKLISLRFWKELTVIGFVD